MSAMQFGLKQNTIENMNSVFECFPQIHQVIIYGSRAKGNFKHGSDIDLTVKGENLNQQILNKISLQLDDLFLPYSFDLSVFGHIKNEELLDHINRVGKIFYDSKKQFDKAAF